MKKNYILINGTLYHHGIKGQKWGERRFQNEDGSLTPEGRERYGYGEAVKRVGKKVGKYVVSSVKKTINKAIENNAIDAQIAADKARRKRDPLYDQRRKQEWEREKWRRTHDPIYKLEKESEEAFKSEQEIERQRFKEKEAKQLMNKAKQEYRNSEEYKQAKDKTKKIAVAGAAVVGAALVAYGTYKYVEATKDKAYEVSYRKGSEAASRIMADVGMKKEMDWKTFSNAYKGFSENIAKTAENNSKNFITSMKYLKGKGGQQSSAELARQGISTFNYGPYSEYMDKALDLYRNGINEDYIYGKKR